MANGHAAVAYLPPTTPAKSEGELDPHAEICDAVVSAVVILCRMGKEIQEDSLTAATRRESALRVYRVHELSRSMADGTLAAIATRESTRRLCRSLASDADFCRSYALTSGEAVIEKFISVVLVAVNEMAAFEKAMAH
jgi:hypothetical protein